MLCWSTSTTAVQTFFFEKVIFSDSRPFHSKNLFPTSVHPRIPAKCALRAEHGDDSPLACEICVLTSRKKGPQLDVTQSFCHMIYTIAHTHTLGTSGSEHTACEHLCRTNESDVNSDENIMETHPRRLSRRSTRITENRSACVRVCVGCFTLFL